MFKYTALIVEPREHKGLEFVLNNFFTNLSDEWGFIIIHGTKNKNYLNNILDNKLQRFKSRIDKLIELNIDNLSIKQYNKLFQSEILYLCISTEIFLVFQVDTMILNKDLLNSFLGYDYVGAPWLNRMVGNGGLSLRKKSKIMEICRKIVSNGDINEDNYFCYQNIVPLNRPSFEEAQTFSVETVFHEKSFGVHAPWKHLNKYEIDFLINKYPEIKTLIELNN
jgi:hypothetical protein